MAPLELFGFTKFYLMITHRARGLLESLLNIREHFFQHPMLIQLTAVSPISNENTKLMESQSPPPLEVTTSKATLD